MGINKEKLSYGGAKHRRKILAEERKKLSYFLRQIDLGKIEERLTEINEMLNTDNLNERDRFLFFFEKKVVEQKLGLIDASERSSIVDRKLNELEGKHPDIHKEIREKNEKGQTMLSKIVSQYFPARR